jgi:hypothetical protein
MSKTSSGYFSLEYRDVYFDMFGDGEAPPGFVNKIREEINHRLHLNLIRASAIIAERFGHKQELIEELAK